MRSADEGEEGWLEEGLKDNNKQSDQLLFDSLTFAPLVPKS